MISPFGIDIAYLMSVVRRIIHKLGVTPLYIQDTAHSHSVTMNQMWVKGDEWPDTLQWQEEEAQAEISDLEALDMIIVMIRTRIAKGPEHTGRVLTAHIATSTSPVSPLHSTA